VVAPPTSVSSSRVIEVSLGISPRAMPRRTMPRAARTWDLRSARVDLVDDAHPHPQRVDEQRLLGVPPQVDGGLANAGPLGDGLDAESGPACLAEQGDRGVRDPAVDVGVTGAASLRRADRHA
jgi:hypothetical protein